MEEAKIIDPIPAPDQMNGERYFQIRDVGRDGSGSFHLFCVSKITSDDEVKTIASELHAKEMMNREQMYVPAFFRRPPKWRDSLIVVELKRIIAPPTKWHLDHGKKYSNTWKTKRKGLRFKLIRSYLKLSLAGGQTEMRQGYYAENIGTPINLER